MKISVNKWQRLGKMRSHSATHLLHTALNHIIWDTKQAGSMVDTDTLRFDFTASGPVSNDQVIEIENMINKYIADSIDVNIVETNFDEAIKIWAKALFDEKYGDIVRVVKMWNTSIELCGWTHVSNTSQIWAFKIIWQEAVASGIRRIIWITWPKVWEYATNQDIKLQELSTKLDSNPKQFEQSLEKLIKEYDSAYAELESIKTQAIWWSLKSLWENANNNGIFDIIINTDSDKNLKTANFKEIANNARNIFKDKDFLIYSNEWNFLINISSWKNSAREILKNNWLKWWGSDQFAQWKDSNVKNIA